jgi:uncharacterized protein YqeY
MTLKEQLQEDTSAAMREGDKHRRDSLRLLLAAIQQEEVDGQTELDDAGVQRVLAKQAKQRRESIADAEKAGRLDLIEVEEAELQLIERYLPQMMPEEQVRTKAERVIVELDATDMKDMGRVMAQLMPELKGKADGHIVSGVVRELLSEKAAFKES